MDEITIIEMPAQMVLGIRQKGSFKMIPALIGELYQYLQGKEQIISGAPIFVCHEKDLVEVNNLNETADVEVVLPVREAMPETDRVKYYELSGGQMAKIIHRGPYSECQLAYDKLFAWLTANNKQIVGPMREVYINDPSTVAPSEIETEIYAPIT